MLCSITSLASGAGIKETHGVRVRMPEDDTLKRSSKRKRFLKPKVKDLMCIEIVSKYVTS